MNRAAGSAPLQALFRLGFWAVAALLAWSLARRSITLGDEGYMLSQAADLAAGKVPYRDFDLFVTPAVWYLNAAIFQLVGPSVIATRIAAAFCLLGTMAVSKRIVTEVVCRDTTGAPATTTGEGWGYAAAALVGVFAVWAFPAWTISFYSPYAVFTAMAALACSLTAMRTGRLGWHLACGLLLGLTIAFKQNYGVLATAGCGLGLLANALLRPGARNTAKSLLALTTGIALIAIPGVLLLYVQGALPHAIDSLVVRPFHGFLDAHTIRYLRIGDLWRRSQVWTSGGLLYMAVPMTRPAVLGSWPAFAIQAASSLHVALYWIPWAAFAAAAAHAAVQAVRGGPRNAAFVTTSIFAAVFFLGVFPRADFNHLINVYQPVLTLLVALAALLFGNGRFRSNVAQRAAAAGCACAVGAYVVVAAVWLRDLTGSMTFTLDSPRAGVLVDEADARTLNHEIALLHAKTGKDEPVFALPGMSMVPFLAERPMPTRYYNYQSVHVSHDAGRSAAAEIEDSGARVLLIHTFNFFADPVGMLTYAPELVESVTRHFLPTLTIDGRTHQLLERRDVVLAPATREWLWPHCEVATTPNNDQHVREELLGRTLYQSFSLHALSAAAAPTSEIVTRCRLQVPPGARLRITADLRQPAPAASPDTASAELWLLADGAEPRRLLREQWKLATQPLLSREAGEEHEIDLAAEAGKTVALELRARLQGPVPPSPGDLHGLTVTWSGGRLETEE